MGRRLRCFLLNSFGAIALVFFSPVPLAAQSSSVPAFNNDDGSSQTTTTSTVGWFLEQEFQTYLQNGCTVQLLKTSHDKPVSSIPVPIVVALGGTASTSLVWHWVFLPKNYTAANAFRLITTSQTLPQNLDSNYFLPLDALQDPETMLLAGTSSILFSTNCVGIIAAAASVDSNIKFLTVSFTAAAKADYQNSSKAELGLIKGDFNSPFLKMYGGNDGDQAALFAHLNLWNWYRLRYQSTGALPGGPLYVLHWFNGYTLYQTAKKSRSADGSINVSVDANYLGFVSGKGNFSGQYKDYGSVTIEDYKFAVSSNESSDQYQFDVIDDVDKIASWSQNQPVTGTFNALPQFSKVLRKGNSASAQHEQVITGVPPSMCSTNLWTLDPQQTSQLGTLTLKTGSQRLIPASESQPPGCAFTLDFVPKPELMDTPRNIGLNYGFKTTIANKDFVIRAAEVDFQTSAFPQLAPKVIGRIPVQTLGTNLQWSLTEIVQDDPSLSSPDQVTSATSVSGPTLSNCSAGNGQFGVPGNGITTDSLGQQVTIMLQQDFSGASTPDISPINLTNCTVSMRLHLLMKSGRTADVDLPANTILAYPKLTPPHFQLRLSSNALVR